MLIKKSITIKKHRTSLSLEKEFWDALKDISNKQECSLETLITKIDSNRKLEGFAKKLEDSCINTLNEGMMTKDLALMVGPDQKWLTTDELLKAINYNFRNN